MSMKKKALSEKPLPEVSVRSTKDQILSAYNEVVELLEENQVQSPLEENKSDSSIKADIQQVDIQQDSYTMAKLTEEYLRRHEKLVLTSKNYKEVKNILDNVILKKYANTPVKDFTSQDLTSQVLRDFLSDFKETPYQANRLHPLLGKMFQLAIEWGWCIDNPVKGVEKYHKPKSIRWLNDEELQRLWLALEESQNQKVANALRLLLLTGSRRIEVLEATWDQFDLERGAWEKQNKLELLPLSSQALKLLQNMKNESSSNFLFPGKVSTKSLSGIQRAWAALCERANLPGFPIHGLRETYASHLAASGLSLSVIGNLLGDSRKSSIIPLVSLTFERLKQATEVFSHKIEGIASNTSSNQKPT